MNIALWLLQGLLAAAFIMAGPMKIFAYDKIGAKYHWVKDESKGLVAFIGACELLGGLGLILPGATRVLPVLTPLAALALAVLLIMAIGYHLGRKEGGIGICLVLGSLAAFVAVGRFVIAPF